MLLCSSKQEEMQAELSGHSRGKNNQIYGISENLWLLPFEICCIYKTKSKMENKLFSCYFETDITFLPGNIQPYSSMLCCNRLAGKNGRKIDSVNQSVINIKEKCIQLTKP